MVTMKLFFFVISVSLPLQSYAFSFRPILSQKPIPFSSSLTTTSTWTALAASKKPIGDPLRDATGIRPSLHPVTINAIADALKVRAKNDPEKPLQPPAEPIKVAATAGGIAVQAIQKRQDASDEDGMKLTSAEEQTVAGRVVGVVMRAKELEELLVKKCQSVPWIAKYQEWNSFGVLGAEEDLAAVNEKILLDPLFTMNRAECLLALFLATVEMPALEKSQQEVPDGSAIDFLDADRTEVLLGDFQ